MLADLLERLLVEVWEDLSAEVLADLLERLLVEV